MLCVHLGMGLGVGQNTKERNSRYIMCFHKDIARSYGAQKGQELTIGKIAAGIANPPSLAGGVLVFKMTNIRKECQAAIVRVIHHAIA